MYCSSIVERLLKAIIRHLYCTLVASVIPMLSCHCLCWLINHIAVYSIVTREGVTTPMLIYINQCSKLQIPMFSFISLQTSTLQHSAQSPQRTLSKHQPQKRRRTPALIFRKCSSVQSCSKLVLLQLLILVCSASLCRCTVNPCGL